MRRSTPRIEMRIYLDHNATTPLDPRVLDAMLPFLRDDYGNPSSLHWFGQRARGAVEEARARVAALLGADPAEIVFTASGSESDNIALRGGAAEGEAAALGDRLHRDRAPRGAEHGEGAPRRGAARSRSFASARAGRWISTSSRASVSETTALVSVMLANNETGVLQPVAEAARLAHARGALVHCDAVQAAGKVVVDVRALGVDLLTLSAHKVYGPKGVGCLYVRRGTPLAALVRGGGQERNRRAGTENVAGRRRLRRGRGPRAREPAGGRGRASRRCATGSRRACSRCPARGATARARGCRTPPTCRSRGSRPRGC